jgi:tRNA(fMet)-specific endonuclease VapC
MILLDTDHLTVLQTPDAARRPLLVARLSLAVGEVVGTTIVNVEEQMRGWLASVAKERKTERQVRSYLRLKGLFQFFAAFHLAEFDDRSAALFATTGGTSVGVMDRKVAAVTIANDALLLTANRKDFARIPGLRFENWLET